MSSNVEPELPEENFISEDELNGLLDRWKAPQPSKSLDQRIANSYHREIANADPATTAAKVPQSQHEVVKMKVCSTCKEEFADKFGFCPVDGTPLHLLVSETKASSDDSAWANVPGASVPDANIVSANASSANAFSANANGSSDSGPADPIHPIGRARPSSP